jgi:hypothetical protein
MPSLNGKKVPNLGILLPLFSSKTVRPIGERFTLVSATYVHRMPEIISDDTGHLSTFILG